MNSPLLLIKWIQSIGLMIIVVVMLSSQCSARYYQSMANYDVRRTVLALNAYCDNLCTGYQARQQIASCLSTTIFQDEVLSHMIRMCTINSGHLIDCNPYSMVHVERCLMSISSNHVNYQSTLARQCFQRALSPRTVNCLQRNNPRLRRYQPWRSYDRNGGGGRNDYSDAFPYGIYLNT